MRVVHFVNTFSPVSETFIYDVLAEQRRQAMDISVLTFERVAERERPFDMVHVLPRRPWWSPGRIAHGIGRRVLGRDFAAFLDPARAPSVQVELKRLSPTVVHAHFGPAAVLLSSIASQMRLPLIASFHGYDVSELPRSKRWRDAYSSMWERIAGATVVSTAMLKTIVALGCPEHKAHVVRVGKNLQEYAYAPHLRAPRKWISVGRLIDKKGHLDAIRAIERVRARGIDARLKIVGDGPLRRTLDAYVRGQGLTSAITLTGAIPHPAVIQELQRSDGFLLCSRIAENGDSEGIPTVLMEAQALGLPCVSTRHAGIPEVFPEPNQHLLAPEGDVDAIAELIIQLAAQGAEALRSIVERGRRHVEEHHDLRREGQRLRDLYHSVGG
jgi:glycosyltransferase involved in cell wall biosynthesis